MEDDHDDSGDEGGVEVEEPLGGLGDETGRAQVAPASGQQPQQVRKDLDHHDEARMTSCRGLMGPVFLSHAVPSYQSASWL